jgi:hypothetical protein
MRSYLPCQKQLLEAVLRLLQLFDLHCQNDRHAVVGASPLHMQVYIHTLEFMCTCVRRASQTKQHVYESQLDHLTHNITRIPAWRRSDEHCKHVAC